MNPHLLLIFKSGYFPRVFGLLMALAGLCYLVNSFAHLLHPPTGAALFNAGLLLPCFVAELSLTLWLLVNLVAGRKWAVGERFSVVDAYLLVFYRWGNRNGYAVKGLEHYHALVGRVLPRPAAKRVLADEGITMA